MRSILVLAICAISAATYAGTDTTLTASLDHTTVVRGGVQADPSPYTGSAMFTLSVPDPGEGGTPTVSYFIQLNGLDLDGAQSATSNDNVTGIHLHDTTGSTDTGGTQHVLNIRALPAEDDADMTFDAVAGTLMGLWDDGDAAVHGVGGIGSTLAVSTPGLIDKLLAGDVYLMVHTGGASLPGGETIGGFVTVVPEPSVAALAGLALGLFVGRRRQR